MRTVQIMLILNWVLGFGLPIAVALVTKIEAAPTAKVLTNLAGTVLATALSTVIASVATGHVPDWFAVIFTAVSTFVVSGSAYTHLWKPTGIAPALAARGVK